ncbi:low affinity iron permease family protein [Pararhizobium sp. YC-54]|uniref:low affinity iron permease family protein n=1 Tax=Pararhizobium sp. YC-54 TaxID=2986920 RepID=UPI0021F6F88D|nr:low affinity iron permease family protein [Pararhizobium sp. YC-54]MCW0000657.1 low affinity iron permease family protein [Pararhizobium sp. YC-54]
MSSEKPSLFSRFSGGIAQLTGKPATFAVAVAGIVLWAITGPLFGFSETWQLVVNTGTTIITFLMVFVLQNSQNRDGKALQAKLDELILTSDAENRFMGIEHLDEKELRRLTALLREAAEGEPDHALAGKVDHIMRDRRTKLKKKV